MISQNDFKTLLGSSDGGRLITSADGEVTGNFYAIVVNQSCVFTALEVDDSDVMTARNLSGNTLNIGMYIGSGFHYNENQRGRFTKIHLASGSVIAY